MTSSTIEAELAAHDTLKFMDAIRINGYAIIDNFLPVKLIASLLLEANKLQHNSEMQSAQTGNIDIQKSNISISARGDQTYWLDSGNKNISESQQAYLLAMDTLQHQLNRQLFLGLFELETHFAIYPIGAVYDKHIDQLHRSKHRILSSVLYLNENWQAEDGGALRLYLDDTLLSDFKDISPIGGRLVVFLSDQFWHEVLIATRQRTSLTGWFRRIRASIMTPKLSIDDMFDAENFRTSGHTLIDLLADQLQRQLTGVGPVINWKTPEPEDQHWQQPLPQQAILDADDLINKLQSDILPDSLAIHHPRNMGHQVATPIPMAGLCDLVAALTNQAMAVYETGPSATMIERQVIRWLSELIGWKPTDNNHINGILTSGGAQANLTALLAARQHSAKSNVWKNGVADHKPLKILVSEHSHYSISRAAGIMGVGTDAVIKIHTDIEGRMDVSQLQYLYQQSLSKGEHIIAVVATAGCTPTGSIDPLLEIGAYCNAQGLWLHVDGAHGASALLSEQHRHQIDGIALADSVVWDGHKLLFMPATVSAVLFKNPANSFAAFAQDASYLFQGDNHEAEEFNTSYRTLECTKRMMGLKLWAAFSLYGVEGMALLIDEAFAKAKLFADKIQADRVFELLMQPQTNIVCFRYRNDELDTGDLSMLQAKIRKTLIESGAFHLTQVTLHGQTWLRTTLMNPMTQASDLEALLIAVKQAALG